MVTEVETREKVQAPRITLEEFGRMIGLPIRVKPWWGSVRHRHNLQGGPGYWDCPGRPTGTRKKIPEVQNGVIVLWEGLCGYPGHSHAQVIGIRSVAQQTMLITLQASGPISQFLLGMDSGHPYVIQVLRRVETVKQALDWLMPNMVRTAIAQGLHVKRQGDWFFIPVNREPRLHKCGIDVPRSNPALKANTLYRGAALVYNCVQTRHRGGLVVYRSVLGLPCLAPFVRGNVRAPDHETLHLRGWHIAVRNRSHPWRNADQRRRNFDD